MSHICRTCLEEIDDSNCVNLEDDYNDIKIQLTQCIPELDLDLIPNAHLCVYCARVLHASYEFKLRCLNSEEIIREHMKDRILPDLDIIKSDFHPVSDLYNIDNLEDGMEVIFIPEDREQEPMEFFINNDELPATDDENSPPDDPPKVTPSRSIKLEERKLFSHVKYASKEGAPTYDCAKCDFKTTRSFLLKQHSAAHDTTADAPSIETYTCDSCPYKTEKMSRLRSHKISHKSACEVCGFATSSAAILRDHRKSHAKTTPPPLKITIKIPNGAYHPHRTKRAVDGYKCDRCKYTTGEWKYFEQHKAIHAIKPNRLQCPECPFTDKRLSLHMKKHSRRAKFKCQICTYSSTMPGTLEKHLRLHT